MPDQMPDQAAGRSSVPDYALDEILDLTQPAQYKALFDETRHEIVSLLLERAATTSELAEVLGKPKGTVGHHLKVLEDAGLIHVVRTKRVRALEAKYYGRTARVFRFDKIGEATGAGERILATAAHELAAVSDDTDRPAIGNIRYARIPDDRATEWMERLHSLLTEFASQPRGGSTTYGLVVGIYPTGRPPLPDETLEEGR
jgi:DNA-binding transcriptional ArsR family regulator